MEDKSSFHDTSEAMNQLGRGLGLAKIPSAYNEKEL
jgi:hypothetical protein